MLEEGLVNHPVVGFGESGRKASELRVLLAKIEESEVCSNTFSLLSRSFDFYISPVCDFALFSSMFSFLGYLGWALHTSPVCVVSLMKLPQLACPKCPVH